MKKLLLVALVIIIITSSLTGCIYKEFTDEQEWNDFYNKWEDFINNMTELNSELWDEMYIAQDYAEQLILAVANDDFETARQYLHPDVLATDYDLEGYFESVETAKGVDFSDGVVIEEIVNGPQSIYSYNYRGQSYEFGFKMKVGDKQLNLYFIGAKNDNGFGIYKITERRPHGVGDPKYTI